MGETLTIHFGSRGDGTYELQVKESWSGHTVSGRFVPPYTTNQLNALQKKLNNLDSSDNELRLIGHRLFRALCGSEVSGADRLEASEQPVQAILRSVIQRTLRRRGTVALSLGFSPECDEFVRFPWELLHNGDHFLIVSGIFTLCRVLLRPDIPVGCELPVHPPLRMLYIAASPKNCPPLETESSFEAMHRALTPLLDNGQVYLDRLEPPTFSELVRYLNSYGGAGTLDDNDTIIPCCVVHFDGHGAYGRLCPSDECKTVNAPEVRKCMKCGTSLSRRKSQTYLCFCDDRGMNQFIDTQALRGLFLSSDVRLAVFSACETATVSGNDRPQQHAAVNATLATALVTAQVPAVVAMPFSLQDDLNPTFMYHFYEALADGRTLEEALSRARQALLPTQQKSWFIPVLYRHVAEGETGPVALIVAANASSRHSHPLAHLGPPASFVGRARELDELDDVLAQTATGEQKSDTNGQARIRPTGRQTHHIALTGPAGIGKTALVLEVIRRNREKFPGGVIGVSLQDGRSFAEAMLEMMHTLHLPVRNIATTDGVHRGRAVQSALRSLASRELPCLVLVDGFEEIKDRAELETWLHFLCALPQEVTVLVTSRSNPENMLVVGGGSCRWYEYRVVKMTEVDLLSLFSDLAATSGLDQRIHLDEPRQQKILREICTLLDGYPLGAELIFGTARSIDGKVYTPEAATRSLEEVRDDLRKTPLAGILAVLEVSSRRLNPPARLLLSYLAAFRLPFSHEQILLLVAPDTLATAIQSSPEKDQSHGDMSVTNALAANWRAARDELVQASFIQFDGRVYTIHTQVSHFALAYLPLVERQRVHRVVAAYYTNLPQPSPEEWFAAFAHLEAAADPADLQEAVRVAVRASWALCGHGHTSELQAMLRQAAVHASRQGDKTGEGQIQCCLGAILRLSGQFAEAMACLRSSLSFHRLQNEPEHLAWTLYELAMLSNEEGNFPQAAIYAQDALAFFREAQNAKGEAWMQMVLGEISWYHSTCYEALGHLELALTAFQQVYDQEGLASTMRIRGEVYEALGRYTEALHEQEYALRLFIELGLPIGQAWAFADKSVVQANLGQLDAARETCGEALNLFRQYGILRGEAWALRVMGDILYKSQQFAAARKYYQEALASFIAIGDPVNQAHVRIALGTIALEEHDFLEAKGLFEQARSVALDHGTRHIEGWAWRGLADVSLALQVYADADLYYGYAFTIADELDSPADRVIVLLHRGTFYQVQKRYSDALNALVHALSLSQHLGHAAFSDLEQKIQVLVAEYHLEEACEAARERHGLH